MDPYYYIHSVSIQNKHLLDILTVNFFFRGHLQQNVIGMCLSSFLGSFEPVQKTLDCCADNLKCNLK